MRSAQTLAKCGAIDQLAGVDRVIAAVRMHTNVIATMQFAGMVIDIGRTPGNDYTTSHCEVLRAHTSQLWNNRSHGGERLCDDL